MSRRTLLIFHPAGSNGKICSELSSCSTKLDARLFHCSPIVLNSFSRSVSQLAGCSSFLTLFELWKMKIDENLPIDFCSNLKNDENIFQKTSRDLNGKINENPVVAIFNLLRFYVSAVSPSVLFVELTKNSFLQNLSKILSEIPTNFLDRSFLIAFEQFIEQTRFIDDTHLFTDLFVENLLLNFSIWNKLSFDLRLSHLQFVARFVKLDPSFNRQKYDVQFFLDIFQDDFR